LLVNLPATINVTLEIGTTSETIEVSASAVTLNTTDASLGIAFNENQVKELPLEGRNVPICSASRLACSIRATARTLTLRLTHEMVR